MIDFRDISVVISGPVIMVERNGEQFNATKAGAESVRKMLPGAEIVLSTWGGQKCDGIPYDVLVLSDDIGGGEIRDGGNINRQICSRRAGIKAATRKYVLAMRSESHIIKTDFLKYWGKYNAYGNEQKLRFLKKRVIVPAFVPVRRNITFHMGDWYYFGLKDDVLNLWDLPYWEKGRFNQTEDDLYYNPHRYVITEFVRKHYQLQFEKVVDDTEENRQICEKVIANNFVLTGFIEYGLDSYKYEYPKNLEWRINQLEVAYSHYEWVQLYNKYCNGDVNVKQSLDEWYIIHILIPTRKVKRSLRKQLSRMYHAIKGDGVKIGGSKQTT